MTSICRELFKALHEGKWLTIEYRNKNDKLTKYWIGIKNLDIKKRMLIVDGLHLGFLTCKELNIYIDSIASASVVEGTYQPVNKALVSDIRNNPEKYASLFSNTANLKILNYLADCNRLDCTPYTTKYKLIDQLDLQSIPIKGYALSDEQFRIIVDNFQYKTQKQKEDKQTYFVQIGMNILSINTKDGLYLLAYKKLRLDVKKRMLSPDEEVTICKEFTADGTNKMSIRKFLDADDFYLLDDFESNQETIKDRIAVQFGHRPSVDDRPYVVAVGMDFHVDLNYEYRSIIDMYEKGNATTPIKAFFGDITSPSRRRKDYPIALLNRRVNLDQLLAIHNAVKYPIAYIQGPPGTGKTNTIINTITTAFFNDKTVLFSSYNNHPIEGVFSELTSIKYKGKIIPFPILRLGNKSVNLDALEYIKHLIDVTKDIQIFDKTLDKNKNDKTERTKKLTELLKRHEELIDLEERKETVKKLLEGENPMNFQVDLHSRQLAAIDKRIGEIGEVTTESAMSLIDDDKEEFYKYLFYTSAKYIKRLSEPKYDELRSIIHDTDNENALAGFNRYISKDENIRMLIRVFPIIATTCISAHNIGEPKVYFDMCIIDEASQCNTAMSLVPILRANDLMLVGDPQQLNPVILLDPEDNSTLRRKYSVSNEYDYIKNSIYKTFLACDSVSDEILLSEHYRCGKDIIEFNNKKYYGGRLSIKTNSSCKEPLIYKEVRLDTATIKNTAPEEAAQIADFAALNKDKSIGVITPFANQKEMINEALRNANVKNVTCGTVHAFQGDEKDIILFSLALTDKTQKKTYDWLKNNKELINVATSRAKEQLIVFSNTENLERLHTPGDNDDIYELVQYVKTNGRSTVTPKHANSRALGIKPYSTETEREFLTTLEHALGNILSIGKCTVAHEVGIAAVFSENVPYHELFYSGRFDFVVYQKNAYGQEMPILAIELDGKEHFDDEIVKRRDKEKNEICRQHGFELIRVENSYARRYNYIKGILTSFFEKVR